MTAPESVRDPTAAERMANRLGDDEAGEARPEALAPTDAPTVHVDPDGDDGGDGTVENPLASLDAAVAAADAESGPALVLVRDGVYRRTEPLSIETDDVEVRAVEGAADDASVGPMVRSFDRGFASCSHARGGPVQFGQDDRHRRRPAEDEQPGLEDAEGVGERARQDERREDAVDEWQRHHRREQARGTPDLPLEAEGYRVL